MSKLTDRGLTSADAADWLARQDGSHSVYWTADAYRFTGSGSVLARADLPIVGGSVTLDGSDPIRRRVTLEIGGGDTLVPKNSTDPLVPFGQYLILSMTIDRATGGLFPWIKVGEFHIVSYTFERPSQIATVEAVDWSGRVEEYAHLAKTSYKGKTVKGAIVGMCEDAVPERAFGVTVIADSVADDKLAKSVVAEAGTGRWSMCTQIADAKGLDCFFDSKGNLVLRRAVSNADDDIVPQNGPDIGTVASPVGVIAQQKNLVAISSTLTREGACNLVRYNLSGTVTRRDKKQDHKKKGVETHEAKWKPRHVEARTDTGAADWGGPFGKIPIVQDVNLQSVEQGEVSSWQKRANSVLQRRRGVIRYLDLDAVGCWQLEPDDKVNVSVGDVVESHYVQAITFDVAGRSAARIRTRQLAVTDPGGG